MVAAASWSEAYQQASKDLFLLVLPSMILLCHVNGIYVQIHINNIVIDKRRRTAAPTEINACTAENRVLVRSNDEKEKIISFALMHISVGALTVIINYHIPYGAEILTWHAFEFFHFCLFLLSLLGPLDCVPSGRYGQCSVSLSPVPSPVSRQQKIRIAMK